MKNNIKTIRRAKGFTLKEIAEEIGCSTTWIRTIEKATEDTPVPEKTFEKIAAALGVPVSLLLKKDLKSVPL